MSEAAILASYGNQTIIFRCESGNIHVVHRQVSIRMPSRDYRIYCHNVGKALDSIKADKWHAPAVTVHYGAASITMPTDEFSRFGKTLHQALAAFSVRGQGKGSAPAENSAVQPSIRMCPKRIAQN